MIELLRDAETDAQVERANEQNIHAFNGRNLIHAFYGCASFDLYDREQLRVCRLEVVIESGSKRAGAIHRCHTAYTGRRKAHRRRGFSRLLRGLDVRNHDAVGAEVQYALEEHRIVPCDTHERGRRRALERL